jgi:hypothetical protein
VARAIADIRKDIESLDDEERGDLIRTLIAELDAPAEFTFLMFLGTHLRIPM